MSDSNSAHSQTRARNRTVTKPRIRHRRRRCHKSRKLNAATRLRIHYYELKIRLNDLFERISHSFQRTLFLKPGHRKDSTGKASSNPKKSRQSFSKNIKHRRKRYRSKRKSKILRKIISKTSLTPIRRHSHRRHNCKDDKLSVDLHETRSVAQHTRKKRSSLTRAKRSISEQKITTNGKPSRKSLGLGDVTTSGGSRKSSLHSFEKRSNEIDENGNEITSPPEKDTNQVGAEVDEDVKADVDLKEKEESKKNYDDTNKTSNRKWLYPQTQQTRSRPPQFARPQERIIIPPAIIADTRRFWKRLGQITLSQLKLKRRDLDSVPPKYVKFGFGWTPQEKEEKRRLKIRRKKSPTDQMDSPYQFAPLSYSVPFGVSQYLHQRKTNAFNNLSTPSSPTDFNVTSRSTLKTSTLTPTPTPTPLPRKTPLTAINRQIPDSNIKFASLIPQIRKAAADSRNILSKLESSTSKSTLPDNIRKPTIPDQPHRDNVTNGTEASKIVGGGGGGSLNKTSSLESATATASPKYSFNLGSLIKYKYANPITTTAEYTPRLNTTLDFSKPTTTPTTATFSNSSSAILTRSLYKPTTEFTAKFHHLLAQN